MFSLQKLINILKNITKKNYFYEKIALDYILSFKSLFTFGMIHPIKKIKENHANIFVLLYKCFGSLASYFFQETLFSLYKFRYLLISGQTFYETYEDYLEANCYKDFSSSTDINHITVLERLYNIIYANYLRRYSTGDKLTPYKRLCWYAIIAKLAFVTFSMTVWDILIYSRYFSTLFKKEIDSFISDMKSIRDYAKLRHYCLVNRISIYSIKYFRSIEDFLLKYQIVISNGQIVWLPDNSILYLAGLKFYNAVRSVVLPTLVSLVMVYLLINFFKIEIYTNIGIWGVLGFFFLWLMSGFNFFVKRYKNGKFTGAIQRFWKRTNAYFWLVEGFLFGLFFYYYLNSSQEPLYMYDESNFNQTFLPNLTVFYFSIILLLFIIFYSYYLLLNISNFSFKQQLTHLLINSVLMIYIFLLESYQFYYLVNTFFEITWEYMEDIKVWTLETENPKIRVKTQYLMLALIAKYWHFIFIFFSWLFLLYKSYERKRVYYSLFGFVIQNCIILIVLNLLFCVQWLKWLIRRYYDVIYYWFFTDSNSWILNDFTEAFVGLLGF